MCARISCKRKTSQAVEPAPFSTIRAGRTAFELYGRDKLENSMNIFVGDKASAGILKTKAKAAANVQANPLAQQMQCSCAFREA